MKINHIVSITDHIKDSNIEREILGDYLSPSLDYKSTVLLVWHEVIDSYYLNKFPFLKAIVRYGVGYDNIDLVECEKRNILVCNTPDYGVEEVADTAMAMTLMLSRNIKLLESLSLHEAGYWKGSPSPPQCKRLRDSKVGIVGLGRIGCNYAVKIKQFVDDVVFCDPNISVGLEKSLGLSRVYNLDSLLSLSDIVSVHTTLNPTTRCLINDSFVSKMKPNSILVNVSRGGIIGNTVSVFNALKSGHLAGFATDVWPEEPPLADDKIFYELTQNKTVKNRFVFTPHTAYYSDQSAHECRSKAANNCLNIIQEINPLNVVSHSTSS